MGLMLLQNTTAGQVFATAAITPTRKYGSITEGEGFRSVMSGTISISFSQMSDVSRRAFTPLIGETTMEITPRIIADGPLKKSKAVTIKLGMTPTCIRGRRKRGADVFADKRFFQSGENQWMANYTNQQVREMRALLAQLGWHKKLCFELSKQFGGTPEMVRMLLKGKSYRLA
jgi:hypothetical protein